MRRARALAAAVPLLGALAGAGVGSAGAELTLPPGFTAEVYVTGRGFGAGGTETRGIPSTTTALVDADGVLYLARSGRRYSDSQVDDRWPIFRIPAGGARLTPETEARHLYGPPLPNVQIAAIRGGREVLVTTFDRERQIGVLYRLVDGRAELLAGGTPVPPEPVLLRQPEGAAIDASGHIHVADRAQGLVARLAPDGRVVAPRWLSVLRPRAMASDGEAVWIASDGGALAPWMTGPGEILRATPDGAARVVLRGPVVAGMDVGPEGQLFVADRQRGEVFALAADGRKTDFARFTDGDAPRTLCFVPDTPATRQAGLAGDLLVVVISRGTWGLNEVVRIRGPFATFLRQAR